MRYFIRILLLLFITAPLFSQDNKDNVALDSLGFKEKYGIRFGLDLSKLGRTSFEDEYSGVEANADYRLTKRLYLAAELGFEEKDSFTDFLDSNARGSYFKVGVDYNLYKNWLGMQNMIFSGIRAGIGRFEQRREAFKIYDAYNQTWGQISNVESVKYSGLMASWIELLFGIKAEIFNNVFLGFNVQLKVKIYERSPESFENIYIPGFGRTYDATKVGTGFSYNLSYLLPIYKKGPKKKKNVDEEQSTDN